MHNYTIAEAMNGRDALALCDGHHHFDLVLLDVMMPGLSGYEVCRILRESHSPAELPVIMLTARDRTGDLIAGLESGANDYLTKPFDARELLARVNTLLKLKEAARLQNDFTRLRTELDLARKIQQSLLPASLPDVDGLRIAVRYQSMVNVGGDFYDFISDDKGLGLFLSDVSGHGIPAALIVSIVKIAFWVQKQKMTRPGELFEEMNAILTGNIGGEFVTACYAFIDSECKVLVSSNAGHPSILVWKAASSEIISLRPFGMIFGYASEYNYELRGISLESGDRILMYTDGLIEAVDESKKQFDETHLHNFVKANVDLNTDEFADRLIHTVTEWSGGNGSIGDDIALIVVDVR